MTIEQLLQDKVFCLKHISERVFGNGRIISDKIKNNRNKRWMDGDFEKIASYMNENYGIKIIVTK